MSEPALPPEAETPVTNTPGAGGWVPSRRAPLWVAILVGVSTSVAPVLMTPEPKWNTILAGALLGAATAAGAYFGMKSAGPRQLP